jgi:hypothetical protein
LAQTLESSENNVQGVRATQRLAENVAHARGLYDGTHAAASDDACPTGSGTKKHLGAPVPGLNFVGDSDAQKRDRLHIPARASGAFANGIGDATSFAHTDTDLAIVVSDDDNGAKAKTTPSLEDFGYTSDIDNAFVQFVALVSRSPIPTSFH